MSSAGSKGRRDGIAAGTRFRTVRGGHTGTVIAHLGEGGQGAVFSVSLNGHDFALKWYHPSYAAIDTGLRARLLRASERGPPSATFLWPIDLAEIEDSGSFGYIMPLRDPGYAGMRDLIARPPKRIEPSLATRAAICLNIADSFLQLHASGFCYQDVNFGNIFFHPRSGDISICDNDNVDVDGSEATVFGTRKFMAPEIVCRQAMPNTQTDLFSMAVLFFYVLHAWHPLDGRREAEVAMMDNSAEMALYGTQPVFLFDPADRSNGPLPGMHEPVEARWRSLPPGVQSLFLRSFTTGLHKPGHRVLEAEWRTAFAALQNTTHACRPCGYEHGMAALGSTGARPCAACGTPLPAPPMVRLGRNLITLAPGKPIPSAMLRPGLSLRRPADDAMVEAHPARPDILGLRNQTATTWRVTLRDSSAVAVPPGKAVRLIDGASIDFGEVVGVVVIPDAPATAEAAQA